MQCFRNSLATATSALKMKSRSLKPSLNFSEIFKYSICNIEEVKKPSKSVPKLSFHKVQYVQLHYSQYC